MLLALSIVSGQSGEDIKYQMELNRSQFFGNALDCLE